MFLNGVVLSRLKRLISVDVCYSTLEPCNLTYYISRSTSLEQRSAWPGVGDVIYELFISQKGKTVKLNIFILYKLCL